MAFDKIIDSAFLDGGMKKISSAIREKTGTADALVFSDAMEAVDRYKQQEVELEELRNNQNQEVNNDADTK